MPASVLSPRVQTPVTAGERWCAAQCQHQCSHQVSRLLRQRPSAGVRRAQLARATEEARARVEAGRPLVEAALAKGRIESIPRALRAQRKLAVRQGRLEGGEECGPDAYPEEDEAEAWTSPRQPPEHTLGAPRGLVEASDGVRRGPPARGPARGAPDAGSEREKPAEGLRRDGPAAAPERDGPGGGPGPGGPADGPTGESAGAGAAGRAGCEDSMSLSVRSPAYNVPAVQPL